MQSDGQTNGIGASKASTPRLLVIGAGSRGNAYAEAVTKARDAVIASVAEPIVFKRNSLGKKYIWADGKRQEDQEFDSWKDYLRYEVSRREKQEAGEPVLPGFDGIFICTLDHTHVEIITEFAPLNLHIMSEKPLATTLGDCTRIYRALKPPTDETAKTVFSIGHVLRYSPHNILLRKLLLEDNVIGDILSIEHTEPVGWWHFAHSYVRGNWRKESTTAPSLLTKSCHDIDLLLWLLCSSGSSGQEPHLPSHVSSTGSLSYFKRSKKPKVAQDATNCLECPAEDGCIWSAKKIYVERNLLRDENIDWPNNIVEPEIEECWNENGKEAAKDKLMHALGQNYGNTTPKAEIERRSWFGRCVWESDNDVCDDQAVTMTWEDENENVRGSELQPGRNAKTASFHMIAFTEKQCERRGRVYGTLGEIEYDTQTIRVYNFGTQKAETYYPKQLGGGHGGGDAGLAGQFVKAIQAVKDKRASADEAQARYIGCSLEDVIRSHAMVFAAEEARRKKKVVDWQQWWSKNVAEHVKGK